MPKTDPDLGYLAAPITVYFSAGSTPTARILALDATQHVYLVVTLVSHLVAQQRPRTRSVF